MMGEKLKNIFYSGVFTSWILCLILGVLVVDLYDRQIKVREIKTNLSEFKMSRLMLNSRAQIQIILCNAALEGRRLNPEEIDTIKRLWKDAEYDRAFEIAGGK